MDITLLTVGSRGDVQPMLALAQGLMGAGHSIRLAAHREHRDLIARVGVPYAELPANPTGRWKSGEQSFKEMFESHFRRWAVAGLEVCRGAEAIIYTPLAIVGYHIAESLGVPPFAACLNPTGPTRAYPHPWMKSRRSLGRTYNRITYAVGDLLYWLTNASMVNRIRREVFGLPAIGRMDGPDRRLRRQRIPQLYAYSEIVCPRPSDWADWMYVTGYWFLDLESGWQPPPDLVTFLEAGPPPLFFDLVSLATPQSRDHFMTALEALKGTGERVIFNAGEIDLAGVEIPDTFHHLDSNTPHSWLLPRVAAVFGHGGTGTVAECLRAGVPITVLPTWTMHHFYGERLHQLGAGAPPIPLAQLSIERVQAAVETMLSHSVRERSAELGRQISAERGVERAVEAIHRHI